MNGHLDLKTPFGTVRTNVFKPGRTINQLIVEHDIQVNRQPTICVLNNKPVLRKDWNRKIKASDTLSFIAMPRGKQTGGVKGILRLVALVALAVVAPIAAGAIGTALNITSQIGLGLIQAGIMVAGAFLINAFLSPKTPAAQDAQSASPTYNLTAQGNQARLLQPIPRLYGRHMIYPDFASTPFADYANNEQYLYQLFCLGVGEYDVEKVRIEETDVWTSAGGYTGNFDDVLLEIIPPGSTVTLIPAEVQTSVEVGGQELKNIPKSGNYTFSGNTITRNSSNNFENLVPGDVINITAGGANTGQQRTINNVDPAFQWLTVNGPAFTSYTGAASFELDGWVGPFIANSSGSIIDKIAVDIVFGQGLGYANDDGGINNYSVDVWVQAQPIDNAGNPTAGYTQLGLHTYTKKTATPQRFTQFYDMTPGRYQVRVKRTTAKQFDNRYLNVVSWGGLRGYVPDDRTYDDVTLLAVRMRATDQLTQQSSRKFNTIQVGKVPVWNGTSWSAPVGNRSPAWAVADMLRNTVYGHGLIDSRIDLTKLLQLDATWVARGDWFDGVFDTKQSLWDSMSSVLKAGRSQPVMVAGVVTFVRDEPRSLARGIFTPRNIVKNSFEQTVILYDENSPDDVIVEYMDNTTWTQTEVQCTLPGSTSDSPARITLFGVVDRNHAWREGMYMAACNAYRRNFGKLSTEMDGRLLIKGDPAIVSHDVPKWGQPSEVEDLDTRTLYLSETPVFTDAANHYIALRMRNGREFGPVLCYAVAGESDAVLLDETDLAAAETAAGKTIAQIVNLDTDREPTICVFGAGLPSLHRFLLVSGTPRGMDTVELNFVNDDARVYTADAGVAPPLPTPVGPGSIPGAPVASNLNVIQDPNSAANPVLLNAGWPAVAGASSYILQLSYDNLTWTTVYQGSAAGCQINALAGNVWFRLAAVNAFRGPWALFSGSFGTATAAPSTVTDLLAVANTAGGSIDISYTPGARATSYEIRLFIETTPGSGVYDLQKIGVQTQGSAYQFQADIITGNGGPWSSFMIDVRSVNASGISSPATYTVSGYTLPVPTNVGLINPYRGQDLDVQWTPVASATSYMVELSARGNVISTVEVLSPNYLITAAQLATLGGPWYKLGIRVRSKNSTLLSNWVAITARIPNCVALWNFEGATGLENDMGGPNITLSGSSIFNTATQPRSKVYRSSAAAHAANAAIISSSSYTMAAWFYLTSASAAAAILSSGAGSGDSSVLYVNAQNLTMVHATGGSPFTYPVPALNTWYHVALTYDVSNNQATMYFNGTQVRQGTAGTFTAGGGMTIGNFGGSLGWMGDLDEVQYYSRVLNANEVKALMQ